MLGSPTDKCLIEMHELGEPIQQKMAANIMVADGEGGYHEFDSRSDKHYWCIRGANKSSRRCRAAPDMSRPNV